MFKVAACLLFSTLLFKLQSKKLTPQKDRIGFSVSFLIAVGLISAFCLGYSVPSPVKALEIVYQPLSNYLFKWLQQYKAG